MCLSFSGSVTKCFALLSLDQMKEIMTANRFHCLICTETVHLKKKKYCVSKLYVILLNCATDDHFFILYIVYYEHDVI